MSFKRWAHAEEGNAADFDAGFYQEQPRTGLLGMSLYDEVLVHSGDYSALGSPDATLKIAPMIGEAVGVVTELWGDATYPTYLKVYALVGSTRVQIGSEKSSSTVGAPSIGSAPDIRFIEQIDSVGALGDLRGEDFILEFYMKNAADNANMRHLRVYSCCTTFYGGDILR